MLAALVPNTQKSLASRKQNVLQESQPRASSVSSSTLPNFRKQNMEQDFTEEEYRCKEKTTLIGSSWPGRNKLIYKTSSISNSFAPVTSKLKLSIIGEKIVIMANPYRGGLILVPILRHPLKMYIIFCRAHQYLA